LILPVFGYRFSLANLGEKYFGIERGLGSLLHKCSLPDEGSANTGDYNPDTPAASYRRLWRYDASGLCWLLEGREVVALTADTATIKNPFTGNITTYRKHNMPALGPLGDSLEDLR
jgi:hypothetical protein